MSVTKLDFQNGDKVYIGSRFVGVFVGTNPVTKSYVVYNAKKNTYGAYHFWQIGRHPSMNIISN